MSIYYNKNLSDYLNKSVRNFNRRVASAKKAGVKNLPDKIFVRELKRRYDNRKDLLREINLINRFNRQTATDEIMIGSNVTKWRREYVKNNLQAAKKYFDREIKIKQERSGRFPSERDLLDTLISNRDILNYDLNTITEGQFEDVEGAIKTFIRSRNKWAAGYRGFMSEVEEVMIRTGVSKEQRDEFFKKFQKLNHEEFFYLYEESKLIDRIYLLIDSPKRENDMNAEVPDARGLVDDLMSSIDVMIDEAKNRK